MIPKNKLEDLSRELYDKFIYRPEIFLADFKKKNELEKEIDGVWEKYNDAKKEKDFSAKEYFEWFSVLTGLFDKWWGYCAYGEDKGQAAYNDFLPDFMAKNNLTENKANEVLSILTHPEKRSIFNIEREDFLNICLYASKKKKYNEKPTTLLKHDRQFQKMVNEYINNYFWVKTDFYSKNDLTPEILLDLIAWELGDKKENKIKAELNRFADNARQIKKQKEGLKKEMSLSNEDKNYLKYAKFMIAWQDKRKEEMMKIFYYAYSLIEYISQISQTSYDDLVSCTAPEIKEFLQTGKLPEFLDNDLFLIFQKGAAREKFVGVQARELFAETQKEKNESAIIKGMVASAGQDKIIRGRVKIITNPQGQEFKAGEILVTSMTRIEFMPLMRKAKAIITDEGGIACHAAIVSRELGLPCIIGTKNATNVLKNRNLVEMDVNNGVVKIIKRS